MSDNPESSDGRPCLHCLIADLIDEFYAEYGSSEGEKDTVDIDEILSALGKVIAEMTYGSDAAVRQRGSHLDDRAAVARQHPLQGGECAVDQKSTAARQAPRHRRPSSAAYCVQRKGHSRPIGKRLHALFDRA